MEISVRSIAHAPRPVAYLVMLAPARADVKLAAGFVEALAHFGHAFVGVG